MQNPKQRSESFMSKHSAAFIGGFFVLLSSVITMVGTYYFQNPVEVILKQNPPDSSQHQVEISNLEQENSQLRVEVDHLNQEILSLRDSLSSLNPALHTSDTTSYAEPLWNPGCAVNNTFQCATPLTLKTPISGVLGSRERSGLFYKFKIRAPLLLKIRIEPIPNSYGTQLTVYDDKYNRIGYGKFEAGRPESLIQQITSSGIYFIHFDSRTVTSSNIREPFTLTITPD